MSLEMVKAISSMSNLYFTWCHCVQVFFCHTYISRHTCYLSNPRFFSKNNSIKWYCELQRVLFSSMLNHWYSVILIPSGPNGFKKNKPFSKPRLRSLKPGLKGFKNNLNRFGPLGIVFQRQTLLILKHTPQNVYSKDSKLPQVSPSNFSGVQLFPKSCKSWILTW